MALEIYVCLFFLDLVCVNYRSVEVADLVQYKRAGSIHR